MLMHAVQLHQSGHYAEAITAYESFLKLHPDAAAVRSNLGAALAHEGRFTEAVDEYSQALAAQPTNQGIRFNLGLAYYKMGKIEDAVKQFELVRGTLPAGSPQTRQLTLLLAESYLRLEKDEKVIALLDPIAAADPSDQTTAYLLGTALIHAGQVDRGALMIQHILQKGDTAEAHMLMAVTRMKANDTNPALVEVNRAIDLNPNLPEAYSLRGRLEYIASDVQAAETAFRKALSLDPNEFDALLFLGTLLREQGRLQEAQTLLEHGMQVRPGEIRVRYQDALLSSAEGDDKKAADLLDILVKDAPQYTEAHRSLATIDFRLGRVAEGRQQRKIAETLAAQVAAQDQARGETLKK